MKERETARSNLIQIRPNKPRPAKIYHTHTQQQSRIRWREPKQAKKKEKDDEKGAPALCVFRWWCLFLSFSLVDLLAVGTRVLWPVGVFLLLLSLLSPCSSPIVQNLSVCLNSTNQSTNTPTHDRSRRATESWYSSIG